MVRAMDNPIVLGMCMTARHDWSLDRMPGDLTSGMHEAERQRLYDQMYQLYEHSVKPVIEKLEAENARLMSELVFTQDQVRRYQNNGSFY